MPDKKAFGKSQFNPFVFEGMFFVFRMVAKVLKEMGILDVMEAKAEASESEVDDKAIRIAKTVLDVLAK